MYHLVSKLNHFCIGFVIVNNSCGEINRNTFQIGRKNRRYSLAATESNKFLVVRCR